MNFVALDAGTTYAFTPGLVAAVSHGGVRAGCNRSGSREGVPTFARLDPAVCRSLTESECTIAGIRAPVR